MLNIFFKPSHIFTVMRPAHGRHFSIKSACCAFPGRLPGLRFTHSLPGGMKIFRLFSIRRAAKGRKKTS